MFFSELFSVNLYFNANEYANGSIIVISIQIIEICCYLSLINSLNFSSHHLFSHCIFVSSLMQFRASDAIKNISNARS